MLVDRTDDVEVSVKGVFVSVETKATWDEDSDTLDVEASASCSVCGAVQNGSAVYQIFTQDSVSTGISGFMDFNSETSNWEAHDVDTGSLGSGTYFIITQINDLVGHSGIGRSDFKKSRAIIIKIEGPII